MNKYLIAEAVGGVMEHPDFDYNDYDVIEAKTEKEALAEYKIKHNSGYWFPECMAKSTMGLIRVLNKAVSYDQVDRLKKEKIK